MLQLSQIFTAFGQRKKDISDVGDSLFQGWMTTIADFLYDMKRSIDPEQFILSETYTVSAEPQASALPSDFMGMMELGTGVFRIGSDGKDSEAELPVTGYGARQAGYYLDGSGSIVFTGITDGGQYRLRYMPNGPSFSSQNDYFSLNGTLTGRRLLPDSKLEYLLNALDVLYSRWDEDISSEISADQRFIRELDRLMEHDRRNPIAFSIPDFTQNF